MTPVLLPHIGFGSFQSSAADSINMVTAHPIKGVGELVVVGLVRGSSLEEVDDFGNVLAGAEAKDKQCCHPVRI